MLSRKVNTYIEKSQLLLPNTKIIVGISGGIDSVVLLHILRRLGYECVAAHCNFQLREKESDRDELFVHQFCQEMKVSLHSITFDTKTYAEANGISIEMAARELRYNWFNDLLKKEKANVIAVAHHADDSIETLLLNLVRGTGLKGLTGIPVKNGKVIRPLLCCSRSEILDYAMEFQLAYVEDSTNAENDFKRNKIRNLVIPMLEEINPSVRQTLYTSTVRFDGTFKVYENAVKDIMRNLMVLEGDIHRISIAKLMKTPDVPTILYELLQKYGFSASTVEDISENLNDVSGKQFFSAAYRLVKDREWLLVSPIHMVNNEEAIIDEEACELNQPVKIRIEKLNIEEMEQISTEKKTAVFDAGKLKFPLKIRKWKNGDVFVPFGMKNNKKLSDFFIDNKFSLLDKEKVYILESDGQIMWVMGYRTDNRFRIDSTTRKVIRISLL
jgi:tRNA(Ile)-lysidine synthase